MHIIGVKRNRTEEEIRKEYTGMSAHGLRMEMERLGLHAPKGLTHRSMVSDIIRAKQRKGL